AKILLFASIFLIAYSCSTTKKVPDGQFLLTKNEYEFESKKKPFKSDLQDYVKQRPNSGALFGLLPLKLMLYNSVPAKFDTTFQEYYDLTKKKRNQESLDSLLVKNGLEEYSGQSLWWKRFRFSTGEPPVVIDSSMSNFSEDNLEFFYFDRGYFDAHVNSSMDLDSTPKKGEVIYDVEPGEPSFIESYAYQISDSTIKNYYERLLKREQNIKVGERYDMNNFQAERDRIVEFLRNRGYYQFNSKGDAIEFTADTTQSDKQLDITLMIPAEKTDSSHLTKTFSQYRFGEIHLYPDSNKPKEGQSPPVYYDTVYEGY